MDKVCVLGLGYIGLPTASILATHGFEVIGVDTNANVIRVIENGNTHINEPGLDTIFKAAIESGNLRPSPEPEEANVFVIAVPTPLTKDKKADLSFVKSATESIIPFLNKGNLVILESTSPPGTTKNLIAPILEKSKLKIGSDLFVAYCPERVLPGRILKEIVENNRIIGGINEKSSQTAKEIYTQFVDGEIYCTDSTTAELVKIMENTYRDVNIALANELSRICEKLGANVWEAIDLANKHPRLNMHRPGPGVGGHCLPIDPWFLVEKYPQEARMIRLSRKINNDQPRHVVNLVKHMTKEIGKPKIALLGASYKGNVDDFRESPAIDIINYLRESHYQFVIYDPYVKHFITELSGLEEAFENSDCAVLLSDHNEFKYLDPTDLGNLMRTKQVLDTRNIINSDKWKQAGFKVRILGKGNESIPNE